MFHLIFKLDTKHLTSNLSSLILGNIFQVKDGEDEEGQQGELGLIFIFL